MENYISTENKDYLILDNKTLWIAWGNTHMVVNCKNILALLLSTQLFLCSCANKPVINNSRSAVSDDSFEVNTFNYKNQLSAYTDQVLDAINTQDRNALYDAFCPKVREEYSELANDIDKAFEFLGGEIQTYEEPELLSEGETFGGGHTSRLTAFSKIKNAETDKGSFTIIIHCVMIYDEDAAEVGIQHIFISTSDWKARDKDSDDKKTEIGELLGSWNS